MTKEQEEAVERLEKRIKDNEDYKTTQVWLTDDVSAVYTVLNMLKDYVKEIEKKDKINSALIDFIYKISIKQPGTVIHYLEKNGFNTSKCNNCITDNDCRKCFKQYFERKLNSSGQN